MTQTEFNGLPGLVSFKVFSQATGLNKAQVHKLRRAGVIDVFALGTEAARKFKYYKRDAARLGKWEMV